MIAWKSVRYDGARQLFSDPTTHHIVEELATTAGEDCRGVTSILLSGERPVAANFDLLSPSGLSGWFSAYDSELYRFSPGIVTLFAVAEEAARAGIVRFDLGYGQHDYKFRLANQSYAVAGGAVWVSRVEAAARRLYRRIHTSPPSASITVRSARPERQDRT
jgi:CelD/BcsL family acetyltransferase involved in cellulose biosynthesis